MTSVRASRLAGMVAATLVAAAGLVGFSAPPASATYCSVKGASAAVDYNDGAGGGIETGCDPNGGGAKASSIFKAAGFTMQRNQDGSVCKVNGRPTSAQCGRLGNDYWALYWSDGRSGWKYSQLGADGLSVPEGGTVAWAWESGSGSSTPGVAPARPEAPTPTPAPTKAPTKKPTKKPTKTPGDGTEPTRAPKATKTPVSSSASTSAPTTTASPAARASATVSPSATPSTSGSASASTLVGPAATGGALPDANSAPEVDGASTPEEEPGGLPAWVPITVIVALAGAAGGAVWWRRRTGAA